MSLDQVYNILVCIGCKTGIPFDHIVAHLKSCHGIKKTLESVREEYMFSVDPMTFAQAKEWLSTPRTIESAIANIPIMDGFCCQLCQHVGANMPQMRTHFSTKHKDENVNVKDCCSKSKVYYPNCSD